MMPVEQVDALLSCAQRGDGRALNDLLAWCRPQLTAVVKRRLPDYLADQVAEDIVQEACELAVRRLDDADWQGCIAFRAWLRKLVRNRLSEWHRYVRRQKRDYRRVAGGEADAVAKNLTPSHALRRRERSDALGVAMQIHLSEMERAVIHLRYHECLPVNVVAGILECAPGYVRNLSVSAKNKLREALRGKTSQFFSSK